MKGNKYWKRSLAWLLCMVLCASHISTSVLAAVPTHGHTDDCYTKELTCEGEEHRHTNACYDAITEEEAPGTPSDTREPECGLEAHTHQDSCYTKTLICQIGADSDKEEPEDKEEVEEKEETVSIISVENPETARYAVKLGTELKNVGLPKNLTAEIEAAKEDSGETVTRKKEIPVTWKGEYEPEVEGEYTLTAEFVDPDLSFDSMPEVLVAVGDAELLETSTSARHTIQWVSGDNSVIEGDRLDITPNKNIRKSVMAQVQFSRGGNDVAAAETIEIRVPAHILYGRDGEPVDTFEVPLSTNATGGTGFYYYIDEHDPEIKADDEIVMKNWKTIDSAYYFRCDIKYNYLPSTVADGYTNDNIGATFSYPGGVVDSDNKLTIVNHTTIVVGDPAKFLREKYEVWDPAWGEEPENSEDYFYIWWNVYQARKSATTQPYTLKISEIAEPGTVLGGNIRISTEGTAQADAVLKFLPAEDGSFVIEWPDALDFSSDVYIKTAILVKYPRTLLSELGEGENLSIKNTVAVQIVGVDGWKQDYSATSAAYVYKSPNTEYPPGYNGAYKSSPNLNTLLTFLQDGMPIEASYDLEAESTYYEADTKKAGSVVALTEGTVTLQGKILTSGEDYKFTKLWINYDDFLQYDIVEDKNVGFRMQEAEEKDYDKVTIYVKTKDNPNDWVSAAELSVNAESGPYGARYILKYADGKVETNSSLDIKLPEETISVKAEVDSKHHRTELSFKVNVRVLPTEEVLQLIENQSSVKLMNEASFSVDNLNQERIYHTFRSATAILLQTEFISGARKSGGGTRNDVVKRRTITPFTATVFNSISGGGADVDYNKYLNNLSEVSFYDLLPEGTFVENIRVVGKGNTTWTTEYVDNWQNSGRTMMILHITTSNIPSHYFYECKVNYDIISTWDNIADNGNQLDNYSAWMATNSKNFPKGEPDTYSPEPTGTPWDYFKDLNRDGESAAGDKDTHYANTTVTIQLPTAAEGGFKKSVRSGAESTSDGSSITVKPDDTYSYKLRYQSDDNHVSSNLVMYDVLETAYGSNPYWQGILTGVSTANATSKGAKVDVYYSTAEGIQPYGASGATAEGDLSDSGLWSMTPPADLSQVTAVAFDLRKAASGGDFTLTKNGSVYVEIFMKAIPKVADIFDTAATPDIKAYNQSGCQVTLDGISTSTEPSNITTVEVKQVTNLNVQKVWDDTGAAGTIDHSKDTVTIKLFADGVDTGKTLVLNQNNSWKGTFSDLPAKTGDNQKIVYTVKESMSSALSGKYTVSYAYDTGSVTITNTLIQAGQLTVSKTVAGNAGDKNKDFAFTVTLGNTGINGTYGDMVFVNGVASFTLKNGEHRIATGLPEGTAYTVTENDYTADGYVTEKTGDIGTIQANTPQSAVFTNTRNASGRLTVSKELEGNDTDAGKDFTFSIILDDTSINGSYSGVTFVNGAASFTLKGGEQKTIENLPSGAAYTVTESDNGGYTVTTTGDRGTIGDGQESVAAFINTRNSSGALTVTKTVAGNAGDRDKAFDFTVTLGDIGISGEYGEMTFSNGAAKFTLKDGESITATDLPNGVKYTVEEENYEAEGYVTEKSGDTGIIQGNGSQTASFTNTCNSYGDLTVTKKVTGNAGDKNKAFDFTVTLGDTGISGKFGEMTFVNSVAEFTLKDGGSITAIGLPTGGTYTVEETDYTADGYETTGIGNTGIIQRNTSHTAEFINNRDTFGSLKVSKKLEGNDTESTKAFTFTVTLDDTTINETFSGVEFVNGAAAFSLKGGESKTISQLPNGIGYTVAESDNEGYTVEKTGDTGTISGEQESEAAFTNTRNSYGDLTVTKTVSGNAGDKNKAFDFTVTLGDTGISGGYGGMTFLNGVAEFSLKDGGSIKATGLPNGISYTVKETDYTADGYDTTGNGDKGTIQGNTSHTVEFINTRNTYGSLKVSKELAGNDTESGKAFTFTVTLDDTTINATYSGVEFVNGVASFSLKGGESKTIEQLPNGIGYKVIETDNDGYAVSSTGDIGTISGNQKSVAAFTNTRDSYGALIVTKKVSGNAGDKNKAFDFTVKLGDTGIDGTYGEMTFVDGVAVFTLKDGESIKAVALPNGVRYTVEEKNYAGDGYVTTQAGDTGKISGNNSQTAAFTNTRNALGSLTVSKELAGNAPEAGKDFTFNITLNDAGINGTYSGVEFVNGAASFSLKGGESKTIEQLPNGVGYMVTEEDNEGYTVTKVGDTGTIRETAASVAAFTNIRNIYGDLTVTKKVSGNAGDKDKLFDFTVILEDTGINGEFGGMTFADGIAAFTLKDGDSITATGLPNGISYTVKETDYTADGYDTTRKGDTGSIQGNTSHTAEFVNTRNTSGSLKVSKELSGNDTESGKAFTFTVTLDDTTVNGSYSGVEFVNGAASFSLKGGESKTIEHLPNGVGYTVIERDNEGYTVGTTGDTGTISENQKSVAAFTNTRNTYGDLTVTKTVTGDGGSTTKNFSFQVTLADTTIQGTYGDMVFTDGAAEFTLKHGERKTASQLPNGVAYTVTESDNSGYTVSKVGDTGVISGGQTVSAAFTNHRSTGGGGSEGGEPLPANLTLTVGKRLDEKIPAESAFTFHLMDENESILQSKQNQGGTVTFDSLRFTEEGVYTYYVTEQKGTDTGIYYDTAVYKAEITVTRSDDYKVSSLIWYKDGAVYSGTPVFKNTTTQIPPSDTVSVTVNKVWTGDSTANRPESVTVQLYKDSKAYGEAVTLSGSMGWKHTWTGLEKTAVWTVDETKVPSGYTKTIAANGYEFTIINKKTSSSGGSSGSGDSGGSGGSGGGTPTGPGIPSTPGTPGTPGNPGNPGTSGTPGASGTPNTPGSIELFNISDSLATPLTPGAPVGADTPRGALSPLPKTGEEDNLAFWFGCMMLSMLAYVGISTKKKKNRG